MSCLQLPSLTYGHNHFPPRLCLYAIGEFRSHRSSFCFGFGQASVTTARLGRRNPSRRFSLDFFIFQSLPGAEAALAPRLLAALGSQRDRYASAEEVQKYSGIAPVTERSGKKKWVHFRWACPKFLRQSFHEWAEHSIAQSLWARAYYQQLRDRGKEHHAAVRALAFKSIRIVFRCWQDRTAYDENPYLAALAKRGSPLASVFAAAAMSM